METETINDTRTISLLSDFGLEDEYVGVMKAVILRTCPSVHLVDLCHAIAPQNILQAAAMLEASYPYFAAGTIHIAVVDPGVGTERKILLVVAENQFFLGPDNGILTPLLLADTLEHCISLHIPVATPSQTFHGRDIIAPAAAELACGKQPNELGEEISVEECKTIIFPAPIISKHRIIGEILSIDHFGNLITSISEEHLIDANRDVFIEIGDVTLQGIHSTYADVAENALVAIINSRGKLEISANMASARQKTGCQIGDHIAIHNGGKEG